MVSCKRLCRVQLFLFLSDVPIEAFSQAVEPVSDMASVVDGGDRPLACADDDTENNNNKIHTYANRLIWLITSCLQLTQSEATQSMLAYQFTL